MKVKCFRKGAKVRYIGNNPRLQKAWGQSIQTILRKYGDRAYGYFPAVWEDGVVRSIDYSINISELELVE